MVVKKKGKKKKPKEVLGDTPITVGGGGDGVKISKITINYDKNAWSPPGTGQLSLENGKAKSLRVQCTGIDVTFDIKGTLLLTLMCNK